ncbi:MAG TPA: ATP-binding protein [Chroococcales cyanobacterium]
MAIPPDHLPIDTLTESGANARCLLTLQCAIANQITQLTRGIKSPDQVLHSIAWQLQEALQASSCLICSADERQPLAIATANVTTASQDSRDISCRAGNSNSNSTQHYILLPEPANTQRESTEYLYNHYRELYQYYHSWLAQGNSVSVPGSEPQLSPALQDLTQQCSVAGLLLVPMLYKHSCIGTIALYQCDREREWTPQEIACVQAIADWCAIALSLAEPEKERDLSDCKQAQSTLQESLEALEMRVAERTAALREANHSLRSEIIERKQVEEQLRQSEDRFRNLVETSSDWVWETDENAVYTYASPKVRDILGYEPSDVLGKTPLTFMPFNEQLRVAQVFAPIVASRQPFTCFDNTYIHKNGHRVILETSGVPIFDAKGRFRGYRGIDREITKRKQAENEARFLHSVTQAIFESQDFHAALSVAIQKVCEATGWDFGESWIPSADGSVLECSSAWFSKAEQLNPFRRASEQLTFAPGIGLPGRVWVSQQPEWRPDVSAESNAVYLRARIAKEVGLKAALGIPLLTPVGVLAVLVFYMFESRNEDQQLIELICASTELGLMIQRKQAEGEIRKALAKEKELRELKSRFVSMTSHEFRTPLTTIQSSAELLERYSHKWGEEKKLTHLHRIQLSVKHMTKLLDDILILGKVEAGKLEFNPVPIDLATFCRNLVEELQLNDTNQHIIHFAISQGRRGDGKTGRVGDRENSPSHPLISSPAQAQMDEKLLRQILENLLSNAIKYSPPGSTVEFTLSYLAEQVVFQICDRGIGIPSEDLHQLFETFHRATNVGTISGTGLGLAIVKRCVDIHQGQIAVESKIGVGTTFTVTLPLYNSIVP